MPQRAITCAVRLRGGSASPSRRRACSCCACPAGRRVTSSRSRSRSRSASAASRRGDDAHAGPRRGARARLRPLRRAGAARRALPDDLAANTVEVEAPGVDLVAPAAAASTPRPRAASAARARSRLSRSRRRGSSPTCACPAVARDALPERLRAAQAAFEATGGLHATGLFTADGELVCVREDVGRHNAFDKVVGRAFLDGLLPLSQSILCVSGRLSFELVQKAAVAGCPLLVAVGAPSSLAVELAADRGITLCGFVRDGSLNVYTEPWRIRACVTRRAPPSGARRRVRLAEGARALRGETLASARLAHARRGVRRADRGRQGGPRAAVSASSSSRPSRARRSSA